MSVVTEIDTRSKGSGLSYVGQSPNAGKAKASLAMAAHAGD